jgi:hypothetical protein
MGASHGGTPPPGVGSPHEGSHVTVALAAAPGRPAPGASGTSGARRPGAAGPPRRPAGPEAGRHRRVVAAGNPAEPAGSLPHRDCRSGQRPRASRPPGSWPRGWGGCQWPRVRTESGAASGRCSGYRHSATVDQHIMMALERGFAPTERPGRLGTYQAGHEPCPALFGDDARSSCQEQRAWPTLRRSLRPPLSLPPLCGSPACGVTISVLTSLAACGAIPNAAAASEHPCQRKRSLQFLHDE